MKNYLWLGLAGAVVLGSACDKTTETPPKDALLPITGHAAALTANNTVTAHLDQLAQALRVLQDSKLVGRVFPKSDATPCPPGQPGMPPPECDTAAPTSELDMTDEAKDAEKWLAEHVFVDSNIEANGPGADATHVVFRLQPANFCPKDDAGTLDADCVKTLTQVPVRLTTSSPAEGDLDIALTVGATHPADVALHHDLVSVTTNLAEVKSAVSALAAPTDGHPEFPDVFSGKVKFAITKNADQDYTLALSILEAVEIGHKPATDNEHLHLALAAHDDIATLRLKGAEKAALASLDFAAIDGEIALNLLMPRPSEESCTEPSDPSLPPDCTSTTPEPRTGLISAHLAGVSAQGSLTVASDALALTHLGLGDATSWVKYNGTQIIALDLNANAGRHFDLTVTDAENGPTVAVSPSFTADIVHDLNAIKSQFDDLDAWLVDGHETVSLAGADKPTLKAVEQTDACDTSGSCPPPALKRYLEVQAGTLSLAAKNVAAVTVAAPKCLVEKPAAEGEERTHPFESLTSGDCQ